MGNALNNNHFKYNVKSNPDYYKIDISLEQALEEGRIDERSLESVRGLPAFEQFYECKFPSEDEIDSRGYRQLLTLDEVEAAQVNEFELDEETTIKLGEDIGGGGDYNVYAGRQNKFAWIEGKNRSNNTMTNVTETMNLHRKYALDMPDGKKRWLLPYSEVYIDDIGIGRGCSDRLLEKEKMINAVNVGMPATDKDTFSNIKAENYWAVRHWIKHGGKLLRSKEWVQLTWIKYKINSDKVVQIEPKADLKKRTGKSPDFAEALMLTFTTKKPEGNVRWL